MHKNIINVKEKVLDNIFYIIIKILTQLQWFEYIHVIIVLIQIKLYKFIIVFFYTIIVHYIIGSNRRIGGNWPIGVLALIINSSMALVHSETF